MNRHREGSLVVFRIMAPGEEYLDTLKTRGGTGVKHLTTKKNGKKTTKPKPVKNAQPAGKSQKSPQKPASHSKGKAGPAPAMAKLYEDGFFSAGRTLVDMIGKLKHDLGRIFKQNELSPVLLRWLRNGKLTRKLNADNQYEYKRP